MFFLTYGEKGPKVVLAQTLLRINGIDVKINGHFDQSCLKAVKQYRAKLNMYTEGPVDGKVFFNLLQNSGLKLIDSLDASGGSLTTTTQRDLDAAGGKGHTLMNERIPGQGVAHAMEKIVARSKDHRIGLLRIFGHGNGGHWISIALGDPYHLRTSGNMADMAKYEKLKKDWESYLDNNHFERHRPALSQLTPLFAPFASAEIHSCTVGSKQQMLIQKLADCWGIPVTAGKGLQYGGGTFKNQWGENVPCTFVLEGDIFRAYPGGGNLQSWAANIESSIPNLVQIFNKLKQRVMGA